MPERADSVVQERADAHDADGPSAPGNDGGTVVASALLQQLARTVGVTPDTVAAALRRHRSERLRAAILAEIAARWGNAAVQRTLDAERRLHASAPDTPILLTPEPARGAQRDLPSHPIVVPDADHPSKRDIDGEQIIQTDRTIHPIRGAPIRGRSWKPLAEVAERVDVADGSGDTLHIDVTYRLESRPAEMGDIPDMWIHTERKALLTLGSGEHAGATIVGQARVDFAPDETLDPKAAIAKTSVGPDHWAQVYFAEAQQYVHLHGPGGRRSLMADAAGNDVLAYADPLRTLVGLRNLLKQQHIAGHGAEVSKAHARARYLLHQAEQGRIILEREVQQVRSHHDHHPGRIAPVRWLAGDIANWLAVNQQQGREHTEDARELRKAHGQLLQLIDDAEQVEAPRRDQLGDALDAPVRLAQRTADGVAEVGAMTVDAVVLGVDAIGKATGIGTFGYHPISKYGQSVEATDAGPQAALVQIVNGVADQWSDAIERARHGDYRNLVDVSVDTLLMIDGARTGGAVVIDGGEALVAKLGGVALAARELAGRLPAEAGEIASAMAEGADAFVAKVRAGGMQMATSGGSGAPGPSVGVTTEALAGAARAAKQAFIDRRVSQAKVRGAKTLQDRLGGASAPDATEWIARVEALFNGDAKATLRFLDKLEARVTEPAPFMRKVDLLLAVRSIAADDLAMVLSSILDARIGDPVAVLGDIEWISTRPISGRARSVLIRRAAKGEVDLDWVKRTRLTDHELEYMGQDQDTSWVEFEAASDIPSRRRPGRLADRPPPDHGARANAKIRGVAGELAAQDLTLPEGLKIERRIRADSSGPATDFELRAPDGGIAELEVKALRPEAWKEALDKYDAGLAHGDLEPNNPVARLLRQVEAGKGRGHKVYVAISDGTSMRSRLRLLRYLDPLRVPSEQLLLLPESEILRMGQILREHMGIPQPTFPPKGGS